MNTALKPLAKPYTDNVDALLQRYPQGPDGPLGLFRVFANSERFLSGKGVVDLLDRDSPLSLRQREIVILRVCALCDCEYEWGVHVSAFAAAAGFKAGELEDLYFGANDHWSADERLLLRCVENLCLHHRLPDEALHEFRQHWSQEQQLEILAVCGNYRTVCSVANTADLPMESWAARFPA